MGCVPRGMSSLVPVASSRPAAAIPPERLPAAPSGPCVIDEVTLRPYPTNGFAQSAVAATVALRRAVSDATHLGVEVHPIVYAQFAGPPANAHWDLRRAVAAAWTTGDPWRVDDELVDSSPVVSLAAADEAAVPVGAARVTADGPHGSTSETAPPTSLIRRRTRRSPVRSGSGWVSPIRRAPGRR